MAYQGLAVNQVAAAGEAGEISETLTLAPPVPGLLRSGPGPDRRWRRSRSPIWRDATDDAVLAALEDAGATEAGDAGLVDAAVGGRRAGGRGHGDAGDHPDPGLGRRRQTLAAADAAAGGADPAGPGARSDRWPRKPQRPKRG